MWLEGADRSHQLSKKDMAGEENLTSNQFLKVYFLFLANLETRCVVFLKDELLLSWELF